MENLPDSTPLDVQLLYKLQNELYDLHDRLQFAENANASRVRDQVLSYCINFSIDNETCFPL